MSETLAHARSLVDRPSTIREGQILGDKYRLEREIGRGSMGTVWSAVHLTLGQRVAIKLIAAEHAQASEARQRFGTEAKAAARLRSRYVVQVYDDGETAAGTPYIVLEYLDGETLEQRLDREGPLPLNDAVRITRHVARALSRAHAQGIVHRDLKPANVFLSRSDDDELGWIAKVLDFGIAKLEEHGIASTTKTGTLLGTPLFMSPEQVRGASSVDSRADLYALGMVFYNMLTQTYAFTGESFPDVLVAICTSPLPDLREAVPWLPGSVADWFQRACAREVSQRFQSADELLEALDLALGVSTGAYQRQSSAEFSIDTLRGHAPPVAHGVPRATPGSSDEFAQAATHAMGMDLVQLRTNPDPADTALDSELVVPKFSRLPLVTGGALLSLLLIGGTTFLLGKSKPAPTHAEVHVSPSLTAPIPPAVAPEPATSAATGTEAAASAAATASAPASTASALSLLPSTSGAVTRSEPRAAADPVLDRGKAAKTMVRGQRASQPAVVPGKPTKSAENAGGEHGTSSRNPSLDIGF